MCSSVARPPRVLRVLCVCVCIDEMSKLEDYFLKQNVMMEKDSDEVGPKARPIEGDSDAR